MSEMSPTTAPIPAFIGPRAAEVAFSGGYTLAVDTQAVNDIIRTTTEFDERFGRLNNNAEVITADELSLIIRGYNPTQKPNPWDIAWHREHLGAYYPVSELAQAEMRTMQAVTRSEITESGRSIVELKVTDFAASIGVVLAAVLVGAHPRGYSRQERSLSTAATGDPFLAQRQIKAMNAVEDLGLEPFIVERKPGYETCEPAV